MPSPLTPAKPFWSQPSTWVGLASLGAAVFSGVQAGGLPTDAAGWATFIGAVVGGVVNIITREAHPDAPAAPAPAAVEPASK